MKGFKGIKLWPNATGNMLMLVSIILVAIIVIGGLVWGFSSQKKENFLAYYLVGNAIKDKVEESKAEADDGELYSTQGIKMSTLASKFRPKKVPAATGMGRSMPIFVQEAKPMIIPMSKQGMMPVFKMN